MPETTTLISVPGTNTPDTTNSGITPAAGTTGASQPTAEAPSQEEIMAEEPAATSQADGPRGVYSPGPGYVSSRRGGTTPARQQRRQACR